MLQDQKEWATLQSPSSEGPEDLPISHEEEE
jgi:hypothetical protein